MASSTFPSKGRIYFDKLEKQTWMDHLATYKQPNYQIHSSPTGLYNSHFQDEKVKCSMVIFWTE